MSTSPDVVSQMRHTIAGLQQQVEEQQEALEKASQRIQEDRNQLHSKQNRIRSLSERLPRLEVSVYIHIYVCTRVRVCACSYVCICVCVLRHSPRDGFLMEESLTLDKRVLYSPLCVRGLAVLHCVANMYIYGGTCVYVCVCAMADA